MKRCQFYNVCTVYQRCQLIAGFDCRDLRRTFCEGPRQEQCLRRQCFLTPGCIPPDNMLPSGAKIPASQIGV